MEEWKLHNERKIEFGTSGVRTRKNRATRCWMRLEGFRARFVPKSDDLFERFNNEAAPPRSGKKENDIMQIRRRFTVYIPLPGPC